MLQRNSPHHYFRDVLAWLKMGDFYNCRNYFPIGFCRNNSRRIYWPLKPGQLKGKELWWCRSRLLGYQSRENLTELKSNIFSELVDPLFLKKPINIKDEDNASKHKNDNLICCLEFYLNKLNPYKLKELHDDDYHDFDNIFKEFRSYYENLILGADRKAKVDFLFAEILELDLEDFGATLIQSKRELDQLEINGNNIKKRMNEPDEFTAEYDETMSHLFKEWKRCLDSQGEIRGKIERLKLNKSERLLLKIERIESKLKWLKTARGKPGRHPKPLSVLTYHLINKCTRWKFDKRLQGKKEIYIYRKDGQHKLDRDWRLIIYLLLDIHLFSVELPEIQEFINKHGKKPADEALRAFKNMLWNSYKNFPPREDRPGMFVRKTLETGFRKLIVNNDGRLQIIRL